MVTLIVSMIYGLLLGIALSIDAFLFSVVYGLTIERRKEAAAIGFYVGLGHLTFSLFGYHFTSLILQKVFSLSRFQAQLRQLGTFILLLLGLSMMNKKEEVVFTPKRSLLHSLLFALSVSLDSLFVGIALSTHPKIQIRIVSFLFFLISATITYGAIRLAHHAKKRFASKPLYFLAGVILSLLAILTLFLG